MPSSTPSSVSRYRPAILVLTGAAAAYTAYLIYTTLQHAPIDGLHRSNAIRRPNARQRRRASQAAHLLSRLERDLPPLGEYTMFGATLTIDPYNVPPATELRDLITQLDPNASPETIETSITHLYDEFLNRLLAYLFPTRLPSSIEKTTIGRWLGDRAPDSGAVDRAAERHARTIPQGESTDVHRAESVAPTELSWASNEDAEGDAMDQDDQTLQRTLYHIAEHRAKQEGVIHRGITCNGCDEKP